MAATPHDYALNLLASRAYTVRNMRRKLIQKGFETDDVTATVERLIASGLLDDARYAEEFARQRLVVGGASVRRVEQQLAAKGISRIVAKSVVTEVADSEQIDTLVLMERIARKKVASMGDLEPLVARRRLFGFLARKGYDLDDIKQVVARILP
jgi:regulatory protein